MINLNKLLNIKQEKGNLYNERKKNNGIKMLLKSIHMYTVKFMKFTTVYFSILRVLFLNCNLKTNLQKKKKSSIPFLLFMKKEF